MDKNPLKMWKGLIKKIRNFEVVTEIEFNEDDRICLENPIRLLMNHHSSKYVAHLSSSMVVLLLQMDFHV